MTQSKFMVKIHNFEVIPMRRGIVLLVALVFNGLINLYMLWDEFALLFHVFILGPVYRWVDALSWLGTAATVIIVLSSISDKPIIRHNRAIKIVGIIVVCLNIGWFLTNRIYDSIEVHQFF